MILADGTKVDDMKWFREHLVFDEAKWYPKRYIHDVFPGKKFNSYAEMEAQCAANKIPVTEYTLNNEILYTYHTVDGSPIPMIQHLQEVEQERIRQEEELRLQEQEKKGEMISRIG